jgi:hypothetical protein
MQTKSLSRISMVAAPMIIACAVLVAGSLARAQSNDIQSSNGRSDDRVCSNRTLQGDYGFTIEGVILGPGIPFRGLALQHYDGRGHITQVDHIVLNGMPPTEEWTPGTGTYSVNPDCTGKGVINSPSNPTPVNLHFVVVRRGKEIHQVVDANAVTAVGIKVEARERDRDEAGGGER